MDAGVRRSDSPRQDAGRQAWPAVLLGLLLCLVVLPAQAAKRIDPRGATLAVTWTGGDIAATFDFCIVSVNGPVNSGTAPIIPYGVRASIGGTAQAFTIASGANIIPVTLAWRDLAVGANSVLSPFVYTPFTLTTGQTGDRRNCPNTGNNGRLLVNIPESAITPMPPGTYTRVFDVEVENAIGGGGPDRTTLTVSVVIPDSIRVSNINDIPLGIWSGIGDMVGSDSLCVFRAAGGIYGVRLSGSGPGGAFQLANGPSIIPYSVAWNDGSTNAVATANVMLNARAGAVAGSSTCNGGASDNATLTVTVLAADIAASTDSGVHSGVLTITVVTQ